MGTFGQTHGNVECSISPEPSGWAEVASLPLVKKRILLELNTMAKTRGTTLKTLLGCPVKAFCTIMVYSYRNVVEDYRRMSWKAQGGRHVRMDVLHGTRNASQLCFLGRLRRHTFH